MAIFSSNREEEKTPATPSYTPPSTPQTFSNTSSSSSMTQISSSSTIEGNMKVDGDVRIDGVVKGTVSSKGKVVVGSTGKIEGDILCQHAEISGLVNGKLKIADILFLKSSARVDGDIQTGKLVMESGVQFNGNCSMGSVATVPSSAQPKPSTPPAASGDTKNTINLNA